ncbi:DUF932 domain-containing protein [Nocardia sp. NPDC048505]|uniref:DUF932 domain-containing protein n=1 Tax=Nocardia sp. NPDC048505 TaxID=3155756 RepID=UPI0033CBC2CE
MSRETSKALNNNTLIGFTDKRGTAWHYRASDQGSEPNHYPGPIPAADVRRRLFGWEAVASPKKWDVRADLETMTHLDADDMPVRTVTGTDVVIWRSDRPDATGDLGTLKPGYEIHQYSETLLDGLSEIITPDGLAVTSDSLAISSAGVLREGRQAWVQIETPDTVTTPEGVAFRPSLLAVTSHDGSIATTFGAVCTVVVCDNTMSAALGEARETGRRIKIRHTKNSGLRVRDARDALGIIVESAHNFAADVAALCRVKVDAHQFREFVNQVMPYTSTDKGSMTRVGNRRDRLTDLYRADERVSPWQGTAFGLLQLMNTYRHHEAVVAKKTNRVERNMSHAITGVTEREDNKTLELINQVLTRA